MKNIYKKIINTKLKKILFFSFIFSMLILIILFNLTNKMNKEVEEAIKQISKAYNIENINSVKCDIIKDKCILKEVTDKATIHMDSIEIFGIRDIITFVSDTGETKPVFNAKIKINNIRKGNHKKSIFYEYFPKNSDILKKNNNDLNLDFDFTFDFRNKNNKNNIYIKYLIQLENELSIKGELKFEIKENIKELKKELDLNKVYFIIAKVEAISKDNYIPDMKYYFYTIDLNRTGATTKKINKVYFNIDNNKKFTQKEFENENKIYFNSEEFEKSESKKIIKNITKEKILSFLLDKKSDTILIIKNNSKKNIKELIKDYDKNPLTVLTNFIFEVK